MNKFCKINIRQWWASLILFSIFLLVSCLSQANSSNGENILRDLWKAKHKGR
jgi:hypothetical protein